MKIRPGIHCRCDSAHVCSYLLGTNLPRSSKKVFRRDLQLAVVNCVTWSHSSLESL